MASATQSYDLSLWVWPCGLYPSRVVHYLKAKRLPAANLAALRIIPITLKNMALVPINNLPARPPNSSLPCLSVAPAGDVDSARLVTQASAVLEFLEDIYPASKGYTSMRGDNAVEAARVRDIIHLFSEALDATGFFARHTDPKSVMWSGMTPDQQHAGSGTDALRVVHQRVAPIERWCGPALAGGGRWIAGTKGPSLADFTVAGAVLYVRRGIDMDMLEECPQLSKWLEAYENSEEFASMEEMQALERGESFEWATVAKA